MKKSEFNIFCFDDELKKMVAYNSFSNALATIEETQYRKYLSLPDNEIESCEETDDLIAQLAIGGFIIEDDFEEITALQHRLYMNRYNCSGLGLTIAPTSSCNFRCVYCFEKDVIGNSRMSNETQEALVAYVKNRAPYISDMSVVWYGGEPLLALDIIESLTTRFLTLSEKFGFNYSAVIVTNGYLLNQEIAKRLVKCKVHNCQITLDGTKETHDSRRPHASGGGTYDKILQNILSIRDVEELTIALRVNVDKDNLMSVDDLRQVIDSNELSNVRIYASPIRDNNECYQSSSCMTKEEFFDYELEYMIKEAEGGKLKGKYPVLRGNLCCADTAKAHVINADGEIYKCWSDIGRVEYSVGNIKSPNRKLMNEVLYTKYDPTRDELCAKCKYLPICMGGCPFDVRTGKKDRCFYYEKSIKKYMITLARVLAFEKNKHDSSEKRG